MPRAIVKKAKQRTVSKRTVSMSEAKDLAVCQQNARFLDFAALGMTDLF